VREVVAEPGGRDRRGFLGRGSEMEEDYLRAGPQLWDPWHCLLYQRHVCVPMGILFIGNPRV